MLAHNDITGLTRKVGEKTRHKLYHASDLVFFFDNTFATQTAALTPVPMS